MGPCAWERRSGEGEGSLPGEEAAEVDVEGGELVEAEQTVEVVGVEVEGVVGEALGEIPLVAVRVESAAEGPWVEACGAGAYVAWAEPSVEASWAPSLPVHVNK